jgi:hypothetical protein
LTLVALAWRTKIISILFFYRSTRLIFDLRDGQSRGTEGDFFTSGTDNDQLSAFALLKRKKAAKVDVSRDRGNTEEISTVRVATAGESVGSSTRLSKLRPLRELTARKRTIKRRAVYWGEAFG